MFWTSNSKNGERSFQKAADDGHDIISASGNPLCVRAHAPSVVWRAVMVAARSARQGPAHDRICRALLILLRSTSFVAPHRSLNDLVCHALCVDSSRCPRGHTRAVRSLRVCLTPARPLRPRAAAATCRTRTTTRCARRTTTTRATARTASTRSTASTRAPRAHACSGSRRRSGRPTSTRRSSRTASGRALPPWLRYAVAINEASVGRGGEIRWSVPPHSGARKRRGKETILKRRRR